MAYILIFLVKRLSVYFSWWKSKRNKAHPLKPTFNNDFVGLWHGASWTFIFWGLWNGIGLVINRLYTTKIQFTKKWTNNIPFCSRFNYLNWFITYIYVIIGWVFFRSQDFSKAQIILKKCFFLNDGYDWYHPFSISIIFLFIILFLMYNFSKTRNLFELRINQWHTPIVLFVMIWFVIIYYPTAFNPFIYFQF